MKNLKKAAVALLTCGLVGGSGTAFASSDSYNNQMFGVEANPTTIMIPVRYNLGEHSVQSKAPFLQLAGYDHMDKGLPGMQDSGEKWGGSSGAGNNTSGNTSGGGSKTPEPVPGPGEGAGTMQ